MTTQTTTAPAALIAEVRVEAVERLSPAFVRVTFGGPALADLGTADGFDTRFKVVFPGPSGLLPELSDVPEEWQAAWLGMSDDERSPMRTYTIREILTSGDTVQLVTDFVVHDAADETGHDGGAHDGGVHDGAATLGPACRWALAAQPGDIVHIVAPHRLSPIYGGTEFEPGELRDLLVIGDETALPAVSRILADVDPGFTGHVFVEVPSAADIVDLPRHDLIDVTWLVRGAAQQGRPLVTAVRTHLGLPPADLDAPLPDVKSTLDVEVWETQRYSSAGEELATDLRPADSIAPDPSGADPGAPDPDAQPEHHAAPDLAGTYAWIAGESWLVKALRRALVTELGMERSRVAFMGYWREGVAMRS